MMDRDKRLTGHARGQSVRYFSSYSTQSHCSIAHCRYRRTRLHQKASRSVVCGTRREQTHSRALAFAPQLRCICSDHTLSTIFQLRDSPTTDWDKSSKMSTARDPQTDISALNQLSTSIATGSLSSNSMSKNPYFCPFNRSETLSRRSCMPLSSL